MRKSDIFMHISSLSGPGGTGTLGKAAYELVDRLHSAGQTHWQILPLNAASPFCSAAGDHRLIDPELLVEQGLLTPEELDGCDWSDSHSRENVLYNAFRRFKPDKSYEDFIGKNNWWLENYALFAALKRRFDDLPWYKWTLGLMMRVKAVLSAYHQEIAEPIAYQCFLQYIFYDQWRALKKYANEKGVRIICEIPVYVPLDSVDVWVSPGQFLLDGNRRPSLVSACPPSGDADSPIWGNPLFDWEKMKQTDYDWWFQRLKAAGKRYDVVRLTHIDQLERCWAVAPKASADSGRWISGPGRELFSMLRSSFPKATCTVEENTFEIAWDA